MTNPLRTLAGCVGLILVGQAPEAAAKTVSLSQEQAVKKAVARHPSIKASLYAARAAAARARQAKTAWYPRIKIEANYLFMGPRPRLNMDTGIINPVTLEPIVIDQEVGTLHNAGVGVSVAWRAFDFNARIARTQAARALVRAARLEGRERAAQIAYATRAAYLAALLFDEVAAETKKEIALAKAEHREHKIKRSAGLGSDLDLARADIRLAVLSSRLTQARQERARSLITLRILLGLPRGTRVKLTDSLKRLGTASYRVSRRNIRKHPTRLRLDALKEAARLQHKVLWRAWWPTLDLVGQVKYQYPKTFIEDEPGFTYTVGAVLTWNIFDGDLLRRQRQEAREKVREVSSLAKATDEEVRRKLADANAKVRSANAAVRAAKRTLKAASVYLRAARVSRTAGTGTALEVRKAEESMDQARLAEIKAYFDGALARASYLLALGRARIKR